MSAPLLLTLALAAQTAPPLHHDVQVRLDVEAGTLEVVDKLTLPDTQPLSLVLHPGLSPRAEGGSLSAPEATGGLERRTLTPAGTSVTLRYAGRIRHDPKAMPEEHARSFSETRGIISPEGVYLSRDSGWLAWSDDHLATFALEVSGLPEGWSAVSEGAEKKRGVAFSASDAVDDVHLIAGPFRRYDDKVGRVATAALLRGEDDALASRYLDVTRQYLTMYEDLLGPYPWSKFWLVENFWETGYGMPSFTLLGPKVIRFPFILHSSYPHELLHNWWGNGVYLSPVSGNWTEGLTAYLADHLVAEQRGDGASYRRRTLSKYADYVDGADDFPLSQFTSRRSRASEAVGYGKWLMVVHMLRQELGDEAFRRGLKRFFEEHRYRRAGFEDLRRALELEGDRSLTSFFDHWVKRAGAPTLRYSHAASRRDARGRWSVSVTLEQTQARPSFPMKVPVYVEGKGGEHAWLHVRFAGGLPGEAATADLDTPFEPKRLVVDPAWDTFRALLPGEVAPSLSRPLGDERAIFALPSLASDEEREAWRAFAGKVCASCEVVRDRELAGLPKDRAVWVLGYGNDLRASAFVGVRRFGADFDDARLVMGDQRQRNGDHSVALALHHPLDDERGLAFVGADSVEAIAGLARKLPHYGRYGFLGFEGSEPTNVLKGEWPALDSPLAASLPGAGRGAPAVELDREPLAKLPPPFGPEPMLATVRALAADQLRGRAYGSPGMKKARALVTAALARVPGLAPAGDDGFEQCWDDADGPGGRAVRACNVIAKLPGRDAKLPAVVLAAHLDHLGTGWPDAKKGNAGKVHPGANDNASGVAVLLQVAEKLARGGPGARTLYLVVTTGEEAGLRGAKRFLQRFEEPKAELAAMVNLDTVGVRTGEQLLVLGSESATEWPHIFMGVGFTTGVRSRVAAAAPAASDHKVFLDAGVPAVQVFGGPAAGYHEPGDTPDKVDGRTLVDVATLAHETTRYLVDRTRPLTPKGAPASAARPARGGRKVALGSVPDFAWRGEGVRLKGVVDGSPAAGAGLQKGDVLLQADGVKLQGLKGLADALRKKAAGESMKLRVRRGDEELDVEVVLVAR